MGLTMIQVYAAGTGGTENAAAVVDIPQDGLIRGVEWSVEADLDADQELLSGELSFIATNTLASNDARGMISTFRARLNLTSSGGSLAAINKFTPIMDLEVSGGERIYLHLNTAAGVTSTVNAIIQLETAVTITRRSRRRT